MRAGLEVAQIWLDGDETIVNAIDREGNMQPINTVDGHALTHDPLVVLVSIFPNFLPSLFFPEQKPTNHVILLGSQYQSNFSCSFFSA